MSHLGCPFCSIDPQRIAFANDLFIAIWDAFPVNEGHLLLVPRAHKSNWAALTAAERSAIWSAIADAQTLIADQFHPRGFNVGYNEGIAAGQTILHFHLHIIPRYDGDVADPRGGIRHVVPARGNYLVSEPTNPSSDSHRLVKGGDDPFLSYLLSNLDRAEVCDVAVAFLLDSGARLIVEHRRDFLDRGGRARILVGDYLDVTEPSALRRLNDLTGNLKLRVYETRRPDFNPRGFHLKTYIFQAGSKGIAFVGSSNLSEPALTDSVEWNYKVVSADEQAGFVEITKAFEDLFHTDETSLA